MDVLNPGYIYQKFREVCLQVRVLNPAQFHSAPKLSRDAMLVTAGVKLELLKDIDRPLFFEKRFRGGTNRLGAINQFEANNKYLENFNSIEKCTSGVFSQVTSLYVGTMQKEITVGGYKWWTQITQSGTLPAPAVSAFDYFVAVVYPAEIHNIHNDLPLALEKIEVPLKWRSDYFNWFGLIVGSATEKLVETTLHLPLRKLEIVFQAWSKSYNTSTSSRIPAVEVIWSLNREEYNNAKTST